MKMFDMPSSGKSHLHCDNSGHARAVVVDAYDIQDPYSLVPELPALDQEPSNSSISQIFIRSCNGISLLNMDLRGATVETLKLVVQEREGIPVEEQYLILDGHKPLRDGTLLTDYDALFGGHQATVEVFPRIRGGKPVVEPLPMFAACHVQKLSRDFELSRDFNSWDGRRVQPVLTTLGVRILRGIMSCVLAAHQAGLAYKGSLRIGHLVVSGFYRGGLIVPETAAVRINDQMAAEISTAPLTPEDQKADYAALGMILDRVFRDGFPLHVDTIHARLSNLAAAGGPAPPPATTQLLQAFVAMADPLVMATMWWNLSRFASSLGPPAWHWNDGVNNWEQRSTTIERRVFDYAVDLVVLPPNGSWNDIVTSNLQFSNNINRWNYRFWAATDLLRFARNWFTHAPEAQGKDALRLEQQVGQSSSAAKLPDLDYYFSCGFPEFMAQVLEHLYIGGYSLGVRCDDLTRVLVPPS